LTYDDLVLIPEEREGDRHELIDGGSIVNPSPVPLHDAAVVWLVINVGGPVVAAGHGQVFVRVDVRLAPGQVGVSDFLFIARDRLAIVGATVVDGAPDLVVEVLSPPTRTRDLGAKLALYERFGVREYWTVDLERRNLTSRVRVDGRYRELPLAVGLLRSTVVPGLTIDPAEFFAGIGLAPNAPVTSPANRLL